MDSETAEKIAEVRVNHASCRTETVGRLGTIEAWQTTQNGELRKIRGRIGITLLSVILLLIGLVANLVIDRSNPFIDISSEVEEAISVNLSPIIEEVVKQVLEYRYSPPSP